MLRLPRFEVTSPSTVEGAIEALAIPGSRLLAGGTDLLPNLKHHLDRPPVLVSLDRVQGLRAITVDESAHRVRIGAGVTLSGLAQDSTVLRHFPSLAHAAGSIASPLIRNMGTIGGNVNLDTRCRYVNQTEFWRSAIGGCLKSEGDVCWVVPKGRNCVAAMSSDCVPVLISLGANVVLVGPAGRRELSLADYYQADGLRHTTRDPQELTTDLVVPLPSGPRRSTYVKWAVRKSIDFPLISVALRFDLEENHVGAAIRASSVVVGVLGSKPRIVGKLENIVGKPLNLPEVAEAVAERVYGQCKPLENVPFEAAYRRRVLRVHTRRAISALIESG